MKPSDVDISLRGAIPFTACFSRAENEIAAALFVWTCVVNGDAWAAHGPRAIGEAMLKLRELTPVPSWVEFMSIFGIVPDFRALVRDGWLLAHGDMDAGPPVEATPAFFERIRARGYVRVGA